MTAPLGVAEAQARLLEPVVPLPSERIAAERAAGRYLAGDLMAGRTQPAADLSAMDGYAVRGDDLAGPWQVLGESAAGHPFAGALDAGAAVRISTGAVMPAGAGAVLLQEDAARDQDRVARAGEGQPSIRHVRSAGFDFGVGDLLLPAGTRLGPAQLALAIAGGHGEIDAHRLPIVAVIDSGDELASVPASCAAHQIPASNGAMLAALAAPFAGSVRRIGPVADRLAALAAALDEAAPADVIVTSGGVSVGDHDLVRHALEAWGAHIDFWRVAMRPGKPLLVGRRGATTVLGLPGNPVSSYVTAFLFLLPLLRRLAGATECLPRPIRARLAGAVPAGSARTEFLRARLEGEQVTALGEQDSSALRTLATANALIERPIGAPPVGAGDTVPVYRLENGGIA